jgi:nitrogen-specific signal transduction histidine kinase
MMGSFTPEMFTGFFAVSALVSFMAGAVLCSFVFLPRCLPSKHIRFEGLLDAFTDEMLVILDVDRLLSFAVSTLVEKFRLGNVAVFLRPMTGRQLEVAAFSGSGAPVAIRADILETLQDRGGHMFLREEAVTVVRTGAFERNAFPLAVTLARGDIVSGVITFGVKASGKPFFPEDIDVLCALSRKLSIALLNAGSFEQCLESHTMSAQSDVIKLASGINHEICNPLGIIRGQCEMFLLNLRDGVYRDKSPLELVSVAEKIMSIVIKEIDRVALIAKKISLSPGPVECGACEKIDLAEEAERAIFLAEQDVRPFNIEVEVARDFEKDLPGITGDKYQVREVLRGIVRNLFLAIKKNAKIRCGISKSGTGVCLKVRYDGEASKERRGEPAFNPFFLSKGTGNISDMGFFGIKRTIERNNGKVSVEFSPGNKTEYIIDFRERQKPKWQEHK